MKSAVVTGGSSMIASALIKRLTDESVMVTALVRPESGKISNIVKSPWVKIVECDINDIDKLNIDTECDVFYHFAWEGTYGKSRDDILLQERNVENALRALSLAKRLGTKKFVTAGSQAEYGVVPVGVKMSDLLPLCPKTEYARAKIKMSEECRKECEKAGIVYIHARILSVYGLGDNPFTMISSAIRKMKNNEETEFTSGTQMWDYLFSSDAGDAFYLMGEVTDKNMTYTLGGGECRPLKEYIEIIAEETGYKKQIGFGKIETNPLAPQYLCADIKELTKIGFEPKVGFREGIQRILACWED